MKRWAFRIFVLLLLGAIINVAVAWGCAVYWEDPRHRAGWHRDDGLLTSVQGRWLESRGWKVAAGRCSFWEGRFAPGYESIQFFDVDAEWGPRLSGHATDNKAPVRRTRSGYLCFALQKEEWRGDSNEAASSEEVRKGVVGAIRVQLPAWVAGPLWYEPNALPVLPIWPGFAINTVFYAGVLWLLFAAPFALRRRSRIKRDLCPKCAYDLRGSPQTCPECGAAVQRKA